MPNVNLREALTPEQVPKMLQFLTALDVLARTVQESGEKPDISRFMNQYRYLASGVKHKHRKRGRKCKDDYRICLCCGKHINMNHNHYRRVIYCGLSCRNKHFAAVKRAEQGV